MRFALLSAVTRRNRLTVTDAAKEAVSASGGWIDDFHLYSNKMICLRCQIPAAGLERLCIQLETSGIHLDEESRQRSAAFKTVGGEKEIATTLQLTFITDEPDLRREVPSVPG